MKDPSSRRDFEKRIKRYQQVVKLMLNAPEKLLYRYKIRSLESLTLPDFLIIGAQKAGTTWLASNLSHHPDIFIAAGNKNLELHYFDRQFYKPLSYYSRFFHEADNRIKGNKAPGYCMLPIQRIRFIRSVMPEVKLVFLIRDPVERAWSHAIMNLVRLSQRDREDVSDEEFYQHFDRAKMLGMYSQILDTWHSVYPISQLFIGFFSDIANRPRRLLEDVFEFLGVKPPGDYQTYPYNRKINQGSTVPMPDSFRQYLARMYRYEIEYLQNLQAKPQRQ